MSKLLTFALTSCLLIFVSLTVHSQTATATLTGTIGDQNGGAIPGAELTIENVGTRIKRTATTNESGNFTVPLLPPGEYTVSVRKDGFAAVEVREVILNVADRKALSIQLKVGDVNAQIEVRADESLISTSPSVGTTIDRTFVGNLPLSGRSFQSLILLTPGIVGTRSNDSSPGEFSVNGQRQNTNYFTVDGVSANTGVSTASQAFVFSQQAGGATPGTTALGTTASLVSVDALEEFKIQTSTYSAEFGRQPGAQVQLITRSGTNDFHGTAFEYLRNDAFDARDWFANANRLPKTPLRQNQFGGTFSGPVILPRFGEGGKPFWSGRDKTFFFFSYEGQRLRIPVNTIAPTVPALRVRQAAATALQPFLNAFPLPTGPEIMVGANDSSAPIDPVTNPAVPSGTAPFATAYSNPSAVDAYSFRVDHAVTDKISVFGRYGYTPSNSLTRKLNTLTGNVLTARTLTLGATMAITPRLNNEIRFNRSSNRGRNNSSLDNLGGAVPIAVSDLTSGYSGPGVKQGYMAVGFRNLASFQINLGDEADNSSRQLNIVDNVTWVKGPHQLKFGIDWRRLNSTFGPVAFRQAVVFQEEASIISSTPLIAQIQANGGARPIYDNYSAYAQDTWKLSQRLTLDLGLRWEINPAPHDANGLRPVVLTGIDGTDLSNVSIAPPSEPFYKTFKTAFAPRAGAAYLMNQTPGRETVLRGGFGVYYDLGSGQASSLFHGYPFRRVVTFCCNIPFPLSPSQAQPPTFDPVPTQLPLPNQDYFALDPDLKLPYTLQWNVGLEQSLGKHQTVTLSYVASTARRLTRNISLNRPVDPFDGSTRPNLNFGPVLYFTNGLGSDYHSLQAQYQRRLSHGLQALVNYTWSHAIDEASDELSSNSKQRGNASFDVRHNFSAGVTYDLPKLSMTGPLGRLLGGIANGWSVDSVFYARTGLPLNLNVGRIFYADGTVRGVTPDVVSGVPLWIKDGSVPGGKKLNSAAFTYPPELPGSEGCFCVFTREGTLGRNVVRLPGIYQLNMAVRRQFNLGERLNLQLKAEAFNVLNHPLFGDYNSSLGSHRFGTPQSMLSTSMGGLNAFYQMGGPRSMQFSIRLSF